MPIRLLLTSLTISVLAAACTPSNAVPTTTTEPQATTTPTTTQPLTTTTVPPVTPRDTEPPIDPPKRGDVFETASDAFGEVGNFRTVDQGDDYEIDALGVIERWLPQGVVDALVWGVFNDDAANVLAVSVIPGLTWRGDPNFVPALLETLTESNTDTVRPGLFRAVTPSGLIVFVQSTGDGFMVSTSSEPETAMRYLEELAAESGVQTVWEKGTCLYIDTETESLPYAPFPKDIVVPCSGAHNAEVLLSEQIGTDLTAFDGETISYERAYECDRAYVEAFGSQRNHRPTLITYMPDSDEWDRGDRYLACVVQLRDTRGVQLFVGPMAETQNLTWNPASGLCLPATFASETIDCDLTHGYQYLGEVTVDNTEWPRNEFGPFTEACQALLDAFVAEGPTTVEVFTTGLEPYSFEQGDRTVRCMAFAVRDGGLIEVSGSFDAEWRVVNRGGIAA